MGREAYKALRQTLAPKQATFLENSRAFLNIADGAVRSGKTHVCLWRFAIHAYDAPPGDMMMLGRTRETIERNAISPLRQMLGSRRVRYNRGTGQLLIGSRLIWVVGVNDAQAMAKVLGSTLVGSYTNEMAVLRDDAVAALWDRHSIAGAKMFGDTNPDSPYHWLNTNYLENSDLTPQDLYRQRFSLYDNPYLPPEYVQRLLRRYPEGSLWRKRMVNGLWVVAEGVIFEDFNPDIHVVGDDEIPRHFIRTGVGADHGTTNPTVFEAVGLAPDGETWFVFSEDVHDPQSAGFQRTNAKHSWAMRKWLAKLPQKPEYVDVDPSAADFRRQLTEDGVTNRAADNAVLDGIQTMAILLAEGRLKIHESCTTLIREMSTYSWDPRAQLRGEDAPLKRDDHGCFVAGTMIETDKGSKPIELVAQGDYVLTRQGYGRVTAAGMTSDATSVLYMYTSDGRSLIGTPNHPVYAKGRGFIAMDALRYADIIQTCESNVSDTKALSSGATQTASNGRTGFTSCRESLIRSAALVGFMKRFTRTITARFRQAIMSTILTAIPSTTSPKILDACLASNTLVSMLASDIGSPVVVRAWRRILERFGPRHLSGIGPRRGAHGTENMRGAPGRIVCLLSSTAKSAKHALRTHRAGRTLAFARTSVRVSGDAPLESTTKIESAQYVGRVSEPTNTVGPSPVRDPAEPVWVTGVLPLLTNCPVYNLTVEGDAPEYYANGILVHNCDAARYALRGGIKGGPASSSRELDEHTGFGEF